MERGRSPEQYSLQAAEREHLQLLSSQAADNSAARDTCRQIAAVKARTEKLQGMIEAVQQGIAATEVSLSWTYSVAAFLRRSTGIAIPTEMSKLALRRACCDAMSMLVLWIGAHTHVCMPHAVSAISSCKHPGM